ncbi:MAG: sugar ABC transporter substrate-binding protein [Solirubrobacterales bacterium]
MSKHTDKRGVSGAGRRPGTYRVLLVLLALLAVVGLAACGSSGSSTDAEGSGSSETSSSGGTSESTDSGEAGGDPVSEAKERLQTAMAEPEWKQPGPAFDAGKVQGKKVLFIGVDSSIPVVQTMYKAFAEAAKEVGMQVNEFDGKGQVSEFNRGMETAISQNYDAVVLLSISPELVAGAVADAERAGVKVIEAINGDPGKVQIPGVSASVSFCYSCAGKQMADYVIADSGGDANGAIFVSEEVTSGTDEVKGLMGEFGELCAECKFDTKNVPIAEWSKNLPTLTRSTLLSNPQTNYLIPLYDGMAISIVPAVLQANKPEVKVVSFNATPSVMEMMNEGEVMAADVGGANVWLGWGLADQTFRVLAGVAPVKDENIPLRTFTKENLDAIDLGGPEVDWYGKADFKANYKKLWKIG